MKSSIIVPVYNAEKYLRPCLESLQAQTEDVFQVICINDGSTDGSQEVLEEFAAADQRITVLQQENAGAAAARNAGYEASAGKYVTFVDADDEVAPDFLRVLQSALEAEETDIAVANKGVVLPSRTKKKTPLLSRRVVDGASYRTNRLLRHIAPHAKLLRRSFLDAHGIRFYEGVTYEDYIYWLECLVKNPRVVTVPETLYSYKKNPDSISSAVHRLKPFNIESRLVQTRQCIRIAEESGIPGLADSVRRTQFERSVFRHVLAMSSSKDNQSIRDAHALLKAGLEPYREYLLEGELTGWKRLVYKLVLDGTARDTLRVLNFSRGKMPLRTVVGTRSEKPNLYVSQHSLPSIEGSPRHLYNVADLIR